MITPEAILEALERAAGARVPPNPMRVVEHSGRIWHSLARGRYGLIWPIEEYLARRKHSPNVAARIKRLNAGGKEEGSRPRGWHPHKRSLDWTVDAMRVSEFRDRYGSAALGALPKDVFIRNGKRRAISHMALVRLRYI